MCKKCSHKHFCAGAAAMSRQCTSCRYVESPTAGTLFHQVKFDLVKAFWIVYLVSTNKKGITSTELSRKLRFRQKTCRSFKRKVMKAMQSSEQYPITGTAEVDETVFGDQEEGVKCRKNRHKKLVVIWIEKKKKGVARLFARVIPKASAVHLGVFIRNHIHEEASLTTDKWTGYKPLKKEYKNMVQIPSSQDPFRKTKSLRGKSKGKPSGQKGRTGRKLEMSYIPAKIVVHDITNCDCCGYALLKESQSFDARQLFDLPPIKMFVTEHRRNKKTCVHCGRENKVEFPEGLVQPAQYVNNIKALCTYFLNS